MRVEKIIIFSKEEIETIKRIKKDYTAAMDNDSYFGTVIVNMWQKNIAIYKNFRISDIDYYTIDNIINDFLSSELVSDTNINDLIEGALIGEVKGENFTYTISVIK